MERPRFTPPSVRAARNAVLCTAAAVALAACGDSASLMEPEVVKKSLNSETCLICEDPNGNVYYNTGHNYGVYNHHAGAYGSDADVNQAQNDAFAVENNAFDPYSRDWSNPDAPELRSWPTAGIGACGAGAPACGAGPGRSMRRTYQLREAVRQGQRWARDVVSALAGRMLAGGLTFSQYATVEEIPESEFDFMFDYASQ